MPRLFLLRHGLAVRHGVEGIDDDARPLTERGERRVRQVARGLKRLKLRPGVIVTSPLPRASRTAEIVADLLGFSYVLEKADVLRPGSSPSAIREWLTTRVESRLMLVGHNPCLTELLSLLTTGQPHSLLVELRKAGVAALRDTPQGRYQIDWISRPRIVRHLSG